jgi:UDP-N-acetylmuramyl pentapeptide phosphotransferase/UDP-N-acetylglucosamine-1-phosphate transferase
MPELQAVGDDQTPAPRGDRVIAVDDRWPWIAGLVAVAASALLAGLWRSAAFRQGWMDVPVHRSSHHQPTPRGGGVAMAIVLVAWCATAPLPAVVQAALLLSLSGAAIVGLVDDLAGLLPMTKFAGQAAAVVPLAMLGGDSLAAGQGVVVAVPGGLFVAGVLLFLVNAWNFMDGINGIAALSAAAVGLVAACAGAGSAAGWVGLGLLAACAGFLPWNAPRARLFMGDAGSHVLGMAVGALLVLPIREPAAPGFWPVLAAGLPFAVDVLGTLARRALDGEPLASAHRRHLYQLAVRSGYSHARVALAYGAMAMILGAGVAMVERNHEGAGPEAVAAVAALVAVVWGAARSMLAPRVLDGDRA